MRDDFPQKPKNYSLEELDQRIMSKGTTWVAGLELTEEEALQWPLIEDVRKLDYVCFVKTSHPYDMGAMGIYLAEKGLEPTNDIICWELDGQTVTLNCVRVNCHKMHEIMGDNWQPSIKHDDFAKKQAYMNQFAKYVLDNSVKPNEPDDPYPFV